MNNLYGGISYHAVHSELVCHCISENESDDRFIFLFPLIIHQSESGVFLPA